MDLSLENLQALVVTYGIQFLMALVIFFVGKWVARRLVDVLRKIMRRSKVDDTLIGFTANIGYAAIMVFVVLAALNQLGVQTTSFIAILGAAGLAIGLALQGSLSNFAAGVMMIIFRPFKNGDFVEVSGVGGVIEEINIFTTQLRTGDNKTLFIPNGNIMSNNIVNYSSKDTRRVDMVFGISYDDDLQAAKQLLGEILAADERILKEPEPTIGVLQLGESSVDFAVRPWVRTTDYWPVHFAIHEQVKMRFDAAGIRIPYPQRDVHLIQPDAG